MFEYNTRYKVLWHGCTDIVLCKGEGLIVECLLKHEGSPVQPAKILEEIDCDLKLATVKQYLNRLMKKTDGLLIKNRHGYGYFIEEDTVKIS